MKERGGVGPSGKFIFIHIILTAPEERNRNRNVGFGLDLSSSGVASFFVWNLKSSICVKIVASKYLLSNHPFWKMQTNVCTSPSVMRPDLQMNVLGFRTGRNLRPVDFSLHWTT